MDATKPTRRRAIASAALLASAAGAQSADAQAQALANDAPSLKHVFDLRVKVAAAQELGEVGGGRRRVIPITGGDLIGKGPRGEDLRGEVLAGGADWQTLRPDGVTLLQARYTVKMSDGQTVGIINTGVRRAAPDVARRMAAGELVDPSLYYFRAAPVFEVGPGSLGWLTESLFVSVGERLPDLVRLKVYQLG